MSWFGKTYVESEEIKDLRISVKAMIKEKREINEQLEELKLKKRLEQEEIKHLTKLHKEKMEHSLNMLTGKKPRRMLQDLQAST